MALGSFVVVMAVLLVVAGEVLRRLVARKEEHLWRAALREFPIHRGEPGRRGFEGDAPE